MRKWITLFVLILITDLGVMASNGQSIALPSIQGYFSIGITQTQWITTAYLMMLAVGVPLSARLAVRYGFKRVFFLGSAYFYVAAGLLAITTDYNFFIFFRLMQGFGSGIVFPLSVSIIALTFSKEQLPLALSLYTGLGFGGGFALAALVGGLFSQIHNFHYIYVIIFFAGLPTLAAIHYLFEETETRPVTKFDFFGYASFLAVAVSLLLLTMNVKAPWNTDGWYSTYSILMIATFIAACILFIGFETQLPVTAFTLRHFKIRAFTFAGALLFILGALTFSTPSITAEMLQRNLQWSSIDIGLHTVVFGIAIGVSGSLTGVISQYTGCRLPSILGCFTVAASCFVQHSFTIYSDHWELYRFLIIRGAGIGMAIGPVTALGMLKIPKEPSIEIARASVMLTILRQLGAGLSGNLMEIITTQRHAFHKLRFSELISRNSPMFERLQKELSTYYIGNMGLSEEMANRKGILYLNDFVNRQANLASINDALFLFGIALATVTTILGCLMIYRYTKIFISRNANIR